MTFLCWFSFSDTLCSDVAGCVFTTVVSIMSEVALLKTKTFDVRQRGIEKPMTDVISENIPVLIIIKKWKQSIIRL